MQALFASGFWRQMSRHHLMRRCIRPVWSACGDIAGKPNPRLLALGFVGAGVGKMLFATNGEVSCESPLQKSKSSKQPGEKTRVAVYGGAFDPITNAHLTCAAEIVHSGVAEEVWLCPCGPRPDKPGLKTQAVDRYCMCEIGVNTMFTPKFGVKVSDMEVFEPEAKYTYDLLSDLRSKNPDKEFLFVIGSDWLQPHTNISTWTSKNLAWKEGDPEEDKVIITGHKLLTEFEFLVIKRPGFDVSRSTEDPTGLKKFGPRMTWLEMPKNFEFIEGNLSSTEIRKRVKAMRKCDTMELIDGLVPPGVLSFIKRKGLYFNQGLN